MPRIYQAIPDAIKRIGWAHGDFAPQAFPTTGHAVFRIRRLNPAQVIWFSRRLRVEPR